MLSWPSEHLLLYLLLFALVAAASFLLDRARRDMALRRRQKFRRYETLAHAPAPDTVDIRRRQSSILKRFAPLGWVERTVVQSGTTLSLRSLLGFAAALSFVAYAAAPGGLPGAVRVPLALIVGFGSVWAWLRVKRTRRIARFGEQLPEIIDVVVRSLKAGHPLTAALGLVAQEALEPARSEFAAVADEVSYGRNVTEALEGLYARVGHPELRFLVASISIAHQTGGNLAEILSRLSRLLRDRYRLTRRVRALSAEGRFSGIALSILPLALFGLINLVSAGYYAELWSSGVAPTLVAISVGLLIVGNLTIYRLVSFRI